MRIPRFSYCIAEELEDHILKDTTVVIDAQNYFYNMYQESGLPYVFGCECDEYAEYLKKRLNVFKRSNIQCYFIFHGGHENFTKRLMKYPEIEWKFDLDQEDFIVLPIFMREVYKQVLTEMNFDYVICEFEPKKECIAFAQKYKCPVISQDIEFSFSGVPYIPYKSFITTNESSFIKCGIFSLENFLNKYNLTKENLATFIVLSDETIFPKHNFDQFMSYIGIGELIHNPERHKLLMSWLSNNTKEVVMENVRQFNRFDVTMFEIELEKAANMINGAEEIGIPTTYLKSGIEIQENDALWFEKGVALQYIPIVYVNLYRHGCIFGSWAIHDKNAKEPMLTSKEIIKYAYNLMTNFKKSKVTVMRKRIPVTISSRNSFPQPTYEANSCVFENGWKNIKSLGLFQHFLTNSINGFDLQVLENIPKNAQLLLTALIYFSHAKKSNNDNLVYAVLLSYIVLSANNKHRPTLAEFFKVTKQETKEIFSEEIIHPLVEFQHCLHHLNYLNKMCGSPYYPTIYSQTYNATFVYKILFTITEQRDRNVGNLLEEILNDASGFTLLKRLIKSYKSCVPY